MDIINEGLYSIKEAVNLTKIPARTVQRLCKKNNLNRQDGRYLITGLQLKKWKEERRTRQPYASARQDNAPNGTTTATEYEAIYGKPKTPFQTTTKDVIHESKDVIHESRPEESHEEKLKRAIELITIAAAKQNVQHKIFTEEEYIDLIGTLDRVEYQQEQIQYLRNRIEKQDIALNNLFKSIEQRNFIEAKQKGYDKED